MAAFRIFSRFAELLDIKTSRAAPAWPRLNADGTVSQRTAAETLADLGGFPGGSRLKSVIIESDLICHGSTSVIAPGMFGGAISGGSLVAIAGEANHPGIGSFRDSATANSGYRLLTDSTSILIAGSEVAEFVIRWQTTRATATARLGFTDTTTSAAPTDGIWLEIVGNGTNGTLTGYAKNNAGPTATASTTTLEINTWFTVRVEVNAEATLATFSVYSEAGALLWSDTVADNIPTAAGRQTGFGVIATESSVDAAAIILELDYLRFEINRTLVR